MVGYSTLKSRVSFPNGGCGTALIPRADIRPAVSTSKEPAQLAFSHGGAGSVSGPSLEHRATPSRQLYAILSYLHMTLGLR